MNKNTQSINKSIALSVSFFVSSFCFVSLAQAEDLQDLVRVAKNNDPIYQAASHRFLSDSENYQQARSRLMPTVSYQYENKGTTQDIVSADNTVFATGSTTFDTVSQGLTLEQPLFDWQIWSRFKQSKATVSRVEAEFQLAEQELILRVSESYFLMLERMDQLETVSDEKDALEQHFRVAERKRAAGLERAADVGAAEARYLEAIAKEVELQSRLQDSRYAMVEITGELPGRLSALSENIEYQSAEPAVSDTWVEQALIGNPELIAAEHSLEESEQEISARRAGHFPTLNLVYTSGSEETGGSLFGGGSELDTSEVSLRFNIPVFQGLYVRSRVRQAHEDRYAAIDELQGLKRRVEREVRDAYQRIDASISQVNALQQSVVAQERLLELKSSGYDAGTYNILEVLDGQKDLSNARQAYTKARYDYVLNTLRLKFAAGSLAEEDVEAVNSWLVGVR